MTEYRSTPDCNEMQDDLAELALGILTGRRRAEVLAHLEVCSRCATEVEQLSVSADVLLQLVPEVEPPVGFEVRLFERIGVRPARFDRLRRARVVLATAAVVVAIAVGFGVGHLTSPPATNHTAIEAHFATATLRTNGQDRGSVATYTGSPAWMAMTIRDVGISGPVICEITTTAGVTEVVGRFDLSKGYGAWDSRLPVPASKVASAQIVNAKGKVLASAVFST